VSLAPSLDAHDLREPEGSRRIVVQLPVVLGWGSLLRARGVRIGVALGAAGAVVVALLTGSAAVADATGTAGLFVPVDAQLVKSAEGIGVPQGAFAPYTPQLVQVTGAAGIPTTDVAADVGGSNVGGTRHWDSERRDAVHRQRVHEQRRDRCGG